MLHYRVNVAICIPGRVVRRNNISRPSWAIQQRWSTLRLDFRRASYSCLESICSFNRFKTSLAVVDGNLVAHDRWLRLKMTMDVVVAVFCDRPFFQNVQLAGQAKNRCLNTWTSTILAWSSGSGKTKKEHRSWLSVMLWGNVSKYVHQEWMQQKELTTYIDI